MAPAPQGWRWRWEVGRRERWYADSGAGRVTCSVSPPCSIRCTDLPHPQLSWFRPQPLAPSPKPPEHLQGVRWEEKEQDLPYSYFKSHMHFLKAWAVKRPYKEYISDRSLGRTFSSKQRQSHSLSLPMCKISIYFGDSHFPGSTNNMDKKAQFRGLNIGI